VGIYNRYSALGSIEPERFGDEALLKSIVFDNRGAVRLKNKMSGPFINSLNGDETKTKN
jgi:hypothetical protein